RALYRMFISRKHLLEWNTTAQVQKDSRHDLRAFFRLMWPAIMIALSVGILIFIINPSAYIVAAPFLLAWLTFPFVAYWLNRNVRMRNLLVEQEAEQAIRLKGRRIWREVECFIDEEDQRPSTGNHQDKLDHNNVDHALSTNTLRLPLWMVTAHDLGCIGTIELANCLESALARMVKSWGLYEYHPNYDELPALKLTASQRILEIENGNLAGHLILLQQICTQIANRPLFNTGVVEGFADTISLLREEIEYISKTQLLKGAAVLQQLSDEIDACAALLSAQKQEAPRTLSLWNNLLNSLAQHAVIVDDRVSVLLREHSAVSGELRSWTNSLARQ